MGSNYPIQSTKDEIKKINFYTSTSFDGCDIMDENGMTYIITDGNRDHTLIDIPTSFIQACGRVRNSKYKNKVIHVFSTSWKNQYVDVDEYKQKIQEDAKKAAKYCNWMNTADKDIIDIYTKENGDKTYLSKVHVSIENGNYFVDENSLNHEIAEFCIKNKTYSSPESINEELSKNEFNIIKSSYIDLGKIVEANKNPNVKISFKELFLAYSATMKSFTFFGIKMSYTEDIENINPLVKEAYQLLGNDIVKALNYNVSNIKVKIEIEKHKNDTTITKIVALSDIKFKLHIPITLSDIKSNLQSIYNELGINRTAKASDLLE